MLQPGWTIAIVPRHPTDTCTELAAVVNAPYRGHRALDIDESYGQTAEQETAFSPRAFNFVTSCADFAIESERLQTVLWPDSATPRKVVDAHAKLATSRLGKGQLWITGSQITHSDPSGEIESMKFRVQIVLPRR